MPKSPNQILAKWLRSKRMTIAQFNREMCYMSGYGYYLLSKTHPRTITHEVIGRLLIRYGVDGPAIAIAEEIRAGDEKWGVAKVKCADGR